MQARALDPLDGAWMHGRPPITESVLGAGNGRFPSRAWAVGTPDGAWMHGRFPNSTEVFFCGRFQNLRVFSPIYFAMYF
jgi:hypothetical protein